MKVHSYAGGVTNRQVARLLGFVLLAVPALLAACDSGIEGTAAGNLPPETELAVQVADLTEVLDPDQRFTSLVEVNWSGTDPDGFVEAYEIRFYDESETGTIGAEAGWARTASRDSLVLLPIPQGAPVANVAFEVRSIDNDGLTDPTPARTVFPVRNSPPTLRLSATEVPPDTTWPAASFAFTADDLDGIANLEAIEVALNDTTAGFVRLPAETDFLTLVASDPRAPESEARLLLGRGGAPSDVRLPGFLTDAPNTLYLRALDAAGFRSETAVYPDPDPEAGETWYAQRVTSPILLVNDFRTSRNTLVLPYHAAILDEYAGAGAYDEWYLAEPFQSGSSVVLLYSENLPTNPDPTLRETLRFWDHIYWVSNNATNRTIGNNLTLIANFLDEFFADGGSLFVNVPIELPSNPEDNLGNGALAVLPLAGLLDFSAGGEFEAYDQDLELESGARLTASQPLPGGTALPALQTTRKVDAFSYPVGAGTRSLYTGDLTATLNGEEVAWPGPATLASLREDGRVALFAVPLVSDFSGNPFLEGIDEDPEAPRDAVKLMLEALGFPR
ncbi:MAG: hypothetical protein AAGI91_14850 [Bacteroidota bacterium]